MSTGGPTFGRGGGEHRVLEPVGGEPSTASRLDALAELWDGELRLDVETVVLSAASHRRWTERLGTDPRRLSAAFAETIAERGGLGEEARDGTFVGRVATVGSSHPHPVAVDERVAVVPPAAALASFALPTEAWDGGRVVPLRGHAIVPPAAVTVPVGDAPPALAALLAATADVPTSLAPGRRVVVVGVDHAAGAVALAAVAAQRRHVTAVVGSLGASRLARALGADATVVVALGEPVAGADRVAEATGGRTDLVVVADPAGGPLAARLAPAVQLLTDPVTAPGVADAVLSHARAACRGVTVHAGRGLPQARGQALRELLGGHEVLLDTLRWQAGLVASPPSVLSADDDLETS